MLNNMFARFVCDLLRERNYLDALALVKKSNIPFVDEPPIMYPDAEQWQRLSRRRIERYGAVSLGNENETERLIEAALNDETSQAFVDEPLGTAIQKIADDHDIPIVLDNKSLEELGCRAIHHQHLAQERFVTFILAADAQRT